MKKILLGLVSGLMTMSISNLSLADDYAIDVPGMHAFVQFRVKHLGYSWLYGRFNEFSGEFSYDPENLTESTVSMEIDMTSLDSNHAERDKHLRSDDFLNTGKYPKASFVSKGYEPTGSNTADLTGDFTLFGVTKSVTLPVTYIGGGNDPWGGYRQGFEGTLTLKPAEFGLPLAEKLGPAAAEVELTISLEGVRK